MKPIGYGIAGLALALYSGTSFGFDYEPRKTPLHPFKTQETKVFSNGTLTEIILKRTFADSSIVEHFNRAYPKATTIFYEKKEGNGDILRQKWRAEPWKASMLGPWKIDYKVDMVLEQAFGRTTKSTHYTDIPAKGGKLSFDVYSVDAQRYVSKQQVSVVREDSTETIERLFGDVGISAAFELRKSAKGSQLFTFDFVSGVYNLSQETVVDGNRETRLVYRGDGSAVIESRTITTKMGERVLVIEEDKGPRTPLQSRKRIVNVGKGPFRLKLMSDHDFLGNNYDEIKAITKDH